MSIYQISKIQLRRGKKNSEIGVPQLASAEMAWAVDTQELFIGNGSVSEGAPAVGNTRILTEYDMVVEVSRATAAERSLALAIGNTDVSSLQASLIEEIDRAIARENELEDQISSGVTVDVLNEITRATTAESSLAFSILAEKTRTTNAEASLRAAVLTEKTRALNAENSIIIDLDAESTLRASADLILTTRINTESTRITNEIARAIGAEDSLDSAIKAERTRTTNADTTLRNSINTEVTRASSAESTIAANVLIEKTRAMAAESTLAAAITGIPALQSMVDNLHFANILDFGADDTGAVTSTAAITAAYNSLPLSGGRIIIPTGTYLLATSFTPGAKSVYWDIGPGTTFFGAGYVAGKFPSMVVNSNRVAVGPYIISKNDANPPSGATDPHFSALTVEAVQPTTPNGATVAAFIGSIGNNTDPATKVFGLNAAVTAQLGAAGAYTAAMINANSLSTTSVIKGLSVGGTGTYDADVGIEIARWDSTKFTTGLTIANSTTGIKLAAANLSRGIVVGEPTTFANTLLSGKQLVNGGDSVVLQRATDTSSSGYFLRAVNAANTVSLITVGTDGSLYTAGAATLGSAVLNGSITSSDGIVNMTSQLMVNNASPTIYMKDPDGMSAMVHVNSGNFYVLRASGANSSTWQVNPTTGRWPLQIDINTGTSLFGNEMNVSGDITTYRYYQTNTGVIFLESSKQRYLYFNGSSYVMPGANLSLNGVVNLSDERVKSNIQTITNATDKLSQIRGCTFIKDEKESAGVIAQEVLPVMPSAVHKEDGDTSLDVHGEEQTNYYSVDYNQIIALLVQGFKEQQEQINELKALLNP